MIQKNLATGFTISKIESCDFSTLRSIPTEDLLKQLDGRVRGRLLDFVRKEINIEHRYWVHPGQDALDLAKQALGRLLESCPEAKDAEFIIYAGISNPMPTVCSAALLSSEFGLQKVSCWDIKSGCSTGVFALQQAIDWFQGKARSGIIVCSETLSKFLKMEALQMSLATGDGACAMYLKADESVKPLVMIHGSDAQYFNSVYVPGKYPVDVANYKPEEYEFTFADKGSYLEASLVAWNKSLQDLFSVSGRKAADVSGYYSHQIDSAKNAEVAESAGIPTSATLNTFKKYGNMGCPGVFINYMEANRQPKRGDLTVFQAVGGGLTWASVLLEHT